MFALATVGVCEMTLAQEGEQESSDAIEEIIVYGDKSLVTLRLEYHRAEEDFYDVFNTLNSDNSFDIDCNYVVNLGSRRRHHSCRPKFARREEANATHDMLASGNVRAGNRLPQYEFTVNKSKMQRMDDLLWEEMSSLLSQRAELQTAFNELARRKQIYESERERR